MNAETYLHTKNLSIGYPGKVLLAKLDLAINKGEMICLLGANGVGKSTLIKTLLGIIPNIAGTVFVNGKELDAIPVKALAQHISIVLTSTLPPSNFTVYELVSLGRTPYTNWLGKKTEDDETIIQNAMNLVDIKHFAHRQIASLSDGERQRVMIAKALAQDTELIILDEPTAHLDVTNRVALLSLLKEVASQTGKGILLSTHELELAIQVADTIWLIDNKQQLIIGAPEDLVLNGLISDTFHSDTVNFDITYGSFRIANKTTKEVNLTPIGNDAFWTQQALEKDGFCLVTGDKALIQIRAYEKEKKWFVATKNTGIEVNSISALKERLKVLADEVYLSDKL